METPGSRAPDRPRGLAEILAVEIDVKIVDIGANPIDGAPPYHQMLRRGRAEVVGFEPNRDALAELNRKKGPRETYLPHAVGDGKRHKLRVCVAPGMTSLLEPDPKVLDLFHGFPMWGSVLATEEVGTVRLDDVKEAVGAHYLKLDIQGAELMVLRHATGRLADALVVHSEVGFLPLYKDQPLFSDIELFLRRRGFALHRFVQEVSRVLQPMVIDNNAYRGLSQLVWSDAVFVRDLTKLAALPPPDLLRFAAIMHDCYGSWDAALKALAEHDRQAGTAFAARYIEASRQPRSQ
jgi:FkbM family methyltransferase